MCVPVYVDGQRVGRFEVDIPYKQTNLKFKVMLDTPAGMEIDEYQIPLSRRYQAIPISFYQGSDTSEIVNKLQALGVPVYSENLQRDEDLGGSQMIYSFRAYETTPAGVEEIFDLDQFIPE